MTAMTLSARACGGQHLEPLDSSGARTWRLGATTVTIGERNPLPPIRAAEQIESDGRDDYALVMSVQGEWTARFGIRRNRVLPKQAVILDLSCDWAIEWSSGRQVVIAMPRQALRALCPGTPRLHGSVLRTPGGGMLADHILSLVEELPALASREAGTVERALIAFIASAISGTARPLPVGRTPMVDTSLVAARVRRHIEENLTDPQLSANTLCEQLGLTRTLLSQAFGSAGKVNDYIRDRRLELAREMIVHSVVAPEPAELALIFGFRDGEQFERAFIRYLGRPPAEARGMAQAK